MRFIFPIILIILAITSFMMFTNPMYQEVKAMNMQAAQYDSALTNSQKLQTERDALSVKYHTIAPDSLSRLTSLLPDNADNIRLIIDIQRMAQSYGLSISSIKFDATEGQKGTTSSTLAAVSASDLAQASKEYGTFHLEFSTTASYENFRKFLKDIETSLRLTDVESIDFNADTNNTGSYTYTVKLKTYWLKQ
jgi:Tfp pilus assembly protein PilO